MILRDSIAYLDHINGKKQQKALGMSMRVEALHGGTGARAFERNKRKKRRRRKNPPRTLRSASRRRRRTRRS